MACGHKLVDDELHGIVVKALDVELGPVLCMSLDIHQEVLLQLVFGDHLQVRMDILEVVEYLLEIVGEFDGQIGIGSPPGKNGYP